MQSQKSLLDLIIVTYIRDGARGGEEKEKRRRKNSARDNKIIKKFAPSTSPPRLSKEESPSDVSHLIPFTFNLISLSLCKLLWVTDEDRSGGNESWKAFNFPSLGRVLEIF